MITIHCAQCIVIGPVCGCVNSKLRASKLGLQVKVSDHHQLIKIWRSHVPGNGSAVGRDFWLRLTTASAQCLRRL